jgi:hypothetical protein
VREKERVPELLFVEAAAQLNVKFESIREGRYGGNPERCLIGSTDHKVERDRLADYSVARASPRPPRRLRRLRRRRGRLEEGRHRLSSLPSLRIEGE